MFSPYEAYEDRIMIFIKHKLVAIIDILSISMVATHFAIDFRIYLGLVFLFA